MGLNSKDFIVHKVPGYENVFFLLDSDLWLESDGLSIFENVLCTCVHYISLRSISSCLSEQTMLLVDLILPFVPGSCGSGKPCTPPIVRCDD